MSRIRAAQFLVGLLVAGLGACSPIAVTPPFHFMETAETLKRGEVSANVAGGGAAQLWMKGGGVGARVRVGLGARQEVGAEGAVAWAHWDDYDSDDKGMLSGGKLSWKGGVTEWLALIAGVGFGDAPNGTVVGGDLGVLMSPSRPGVLAPYLGLRLGLGVPVASDGKSTIGLTPIIGVALAAGSIVRLHAEMGWLNAWGTPLGHESYEWRSAFYGGLGLTVVFRRRSR